MKYYIHVNEEDENCDLWVYSPFINDDNYIDYYTTFSKIQAERFDLHTARIILKLGKKNKLLSNDQRTIIPINI